MKTGDKMQISSLDSYKNIASKSAIFALTATVVAGSLMTASNFLNKDINNSNQATAEIAAYSEEYSKKAQGEAPRLFPNGI